MATSEKTSRSSATALEYIQLSFDFHMPLAEQCPILKEGGEGVIIKLTSMHDEKRNVYKRILALSSHLADHKRTRSLTNV